MKRVLITGVSRGIGNGLARYYLDTGAEVFGSARNEKQITSLEKTYGDRFHPLIFDVQDNEAITSAVETVKKSTDGIDILINNAGIAPDEPGHGVTDIDESQVMDAFDVNVLGPARVLKAFFPILQNGDSPKVIVISSTAGSMGRTQGGRAIPYCVSKAALNMLALLLSFRLEKHNIPIAALHPGWVKTDMGGPAAALTVEESAASMAKVIDSLTLQSPVYLDYTGKELPW